MGAQEEVVVDSTGCGVEEKMTEGDFAYSRDQSQIPEICTSYSLYKLGLAKKLGFQGKKRRDRAIDLLKSWLTAQQSVAQEDLTKIWKGLLYCLQHADKRPLIQVDLTENYASLIQNLDLKLSQQYFKVFLLTLRQERSWIDNLQLDKLYLLLKQFLRHIFIVLRSNAWHPDLIKGFMEDLTEQAFLAFGGFPAHQGIAFCIANVYLNELQDFLPLQVETFVLLIEPFFSVLAKASNQCLLRRIKDTVFERLLESGRNLINLKQEGKDVDDRVEKLGSIVLTMGTTSRLFKMATFSSTLHENRRVLYELHEKFSELDRLLVISGISLHFPPSNRTKIDNSVSADKSSETSKLAILDSLDAAASCQFQQLDIIDNREDGSPSRMKKNLGKKRKPRKPQKISKEVAGSDEEKRMAKGSSELHIKKLQCKVLTNIVEEASTNNTALNQDTTKEEDVSDQRSHDDFVELGDPVISDLEREFEKVATELEDCTSPLPSLVFSVSPLSSGSQKRKRVMSVGKAITANLSALDDHENEESVSAICFHERISAKKKIGDKSVKKVTFSLKHNLIWKPSSPLPPYSLRVPSSARPRGSALKKGVPPGPICIIKQSPSPKKIVSKKRCVMGRKSPKNSKGFSARPQLLWKNQGDSFDICNALSESSAPHWQMN